MTITLEAIEAEHSKIAEMIAAFKAQKPSLYVVPGGPIQLMPGEEYAGIVLDQDGNPSHHLILLPAETDAIKWDDARRWALDNGGELPTRQEQALLYANLKRCFKSAWYWSCEQHASDSDSAWYQHFRGGDQGYNNVTTKLRARAVRRLTIQ